MNSDDDSGNKFYHILYDVLHDSLWINRLVWIYKRENIMLDVVQTIMRRKLTLTSAQRRNRLAINF